MFDRIASVYDLMNSVMTAGLHHRWRGRDRRPRAASHAGDRALDVATGTGDLALELQRRVGPGGEVVGCDFSDSDARAGAREGPARALRARQRARASLCRRLVRRGDRRLRRAQLLRPRARPGRDGRASCARAAGSSCSRSRLRRGRRCRGSSTSGSTGSCRCSAGRPGTPTPTPTCRSSVRRFPDAVRLAGLLAEAGLVEVRYMRHGRRGDRDPRGHVRPHDRPARAAATVSGAGSSSRRCSTRAAPYLRELLDAHRGAPERDRGRRRARRSRRTQPTR